MIIRNFNVYMKIQDDPYKKNDSIVDDWKIKFKKFVKCLIRYILHIVAFRIKDLFISLTIQYNAHNKEYT